MKRVAIIGAGHNGLVAACYLAEAGFNVTVYEQRGIVGGLSVTEEIFPGCKVSSLATRHGMLRKFISRDLNLDKYGLEPYRGDHASVLISNGDCVNFPNGTRDENPGRYNIRNLKDIHIQEWNKFWQHVGIAADLLAENQNDPEFTRADYQQTLSDKGLRIFAESVFSRTLVDTIEDYISHPSLVAVAAGMNFGHPCRAGSLYEMIYLGTAESFDRRGQWGYLKGGMGALTQALALEANGRLVNIKTNTPVKTVHRDGQGYVLKLENDLTESYDIAIAATDPYTAYCHLLSDEPLPKDIMAAAKASKTDLSKAIVHLRLSDLPKIQAFSELGRIGNRAFSGQFDFCPPIDETKKAYAAYQRDGTTFGNNTMIISNMISAMDDSVTSGKGHVWTFVHYYCPAEYNGGAWSQEGRDSLLNTTINSIRPWVSNLDSIVQDHHIITPDDLRDVYGLNSLSPAHVDLHPENLLETRPFRAHPGHASPLENFYLCSAGTSPGPMITGVPGYNCAQTIIKKEIACPSP